MKTCSKCHETKPTTDFYSHTQTADRLRAECRQCANVAGRQYHASHKEQGAARAKLWHESNVNKLPAIQRRHLLKKKYGLTESDFESMVVAQGGKCAICGSIPDGAGHLGRLNVDHDHKDGVVRGLLCLWCNGALGWYEQFGVAAAGYLGKCKKETE